MQPERGFETAYGLICSFCAACWYNNIYMRCQICQQNEATVHLTDISEKHRTEMHVCELCAQQQGLTVKSHISLNELLSGLLAAQPADDDVLGELKEEAACPRCGFTLEDFRRTGLLGCPADYRAFEKALMPLVEKAHDGGTSHCGKVPSRLRTGARKENRLWNLRRLLDEAVRGEDYEKAAVLRDEIQKLRSG